MDDTVTVIATALAILLFILAPFGAVYLLLDFEQPKTFVDTCSKQGYYQYKQQRVNCSLEAIKK